MEKFVRQPPQVFDEALLVVGGEVDEYRVFLGFYGDLLDPNAITSAIGRSPTSSAVKGDIVYKTDRTREEKTGKWLLRVDANSGDSLMPIIPRRIDIDR